MSLVNDLIDILPSARKQYVSTYDFILYDDKGYSIEYVPDPEQPEGYELVNTAIGELRMSYQPIIWTWKLKSK